MPVQSNDERHERRLRCAARRAKQRAANVVLAQKMHAVRLSGDYATHAIVSDFAIDPRFQAYVGCSGWYYWHWKGLFYPENLASNRWFDHYASQFDTVELNAPFYSWPTLGTVKTWIRQAGRRKMVYTVKVSELITHTKRFSGTKTLVRDFGIIADVLGPRMGCFLFQLPPSFRYSAGALKRIVAQLEPNRRNVVEFRHPSWWNETVFKAFREAGIIFCSCSGPRLPDQLVKTSDDIYVRFHGIKRWYRHDYSKTELALWVSRIRHSGAKRVWGYFNNDRDGFAIKNARQLTLMLKRGA